MKFTINSTALNKALKKVAPAVSVNRVIPILEFVKFEVRKSRCFVITTNLNLTIITEVDCESSEEFDAVIPHKDLFSISSLFIGQPFTIDVSENIVGKCGKETFKLGKKEDAINFPRNPVLSNEESFQVDGSFIETVKSAAKCVAKDEAHYHLYDVFINFTKQGVDVFATDSFQFYKRTLDYESKKESNIALPPKFVDSMAEYKTGEITIDESFLKFSSDNTSVYAKLSENRMPNYSVVFVEHKPNLKIDRSVLLSNLNSIMIFDGQIHSFKTTFKKGGIDLSFSEYETGKSWDNNIECEHTVDMKSITISANMLKNLIMLIPEAEIAELSFISEKYPVYIDVQETKTTLAVMPLLQTI